MIKIYFGFTPSRLSSNTIFSYFCGMKTLDRLIIYLLFLCCLPSCLDNPLPDPKTLLRKAEHSIDANPEAALHSLDSISAPSVSLRKSDYMKYAMLHVEAAFMSGKEIKNDTAIFEACRYYEKNDDLPQHAQATLLSACVLEEQGQTDAAVDAYNKAFSLASQIADSMLMARAKFYLGNLNYNSSYFDEALRNYKEACMYYAFNLSRKAQMYRAIGQTFILQHENDSALHYLGKGLEMAKKAENVAEESKLLNAMSIVYREKEDYGQSLMLLKQSAIAGEADNDSIRHHLNYANLFLGLNEMDSAGYYAEKLQGEVKDVEDGAEKTAIFSFLTKYEESIGNVDSAYHTHQLYTEILSSEYRKQLQQSVYEAQQKYDFEAQQNQYYQELAQRRKTILFLVFVLLSLALFLSVVLFVLLRREKEMLQLKDDFLSFKQQTVELQNELDSRKKQQDGQTDLLQRTLDLLNAANANKDERLRNRFKILCNMEVYRLNTSDKALLSTLCSSLYGKSDFWAAALKVVDELYPHVTQNIRQSCPDLTDDEFKTAVFILMNVPRPTEAILLDTTINMVDKNRPKIRRMLTEHKILEQKVRNE